MCDKPMGGGCCGECEDRRKCVLIGAAAGIFLLYLLLAE